MSDARLARVRRLLAEEPRHDTDGEAQAGVLSRQCRALSRAVAARGVAVSVVDAERLGVPLATSGPQVAELEEMQFTLGEGPSLDAHDSRRPALEPDLAGHGRARWPAYSDVMVGRGVGAVFAFPMQVGAARLAVQAIYTSDGAPLSAQSLLDALDFATLGVETLLAGPLDGEPGTGVVNVLGNYSEVYQAQGMVMAQLGVSLADAMVRMRADAYCRNIPLSELAGDIVAHRTTLDADPVDGAAPDA